MADETDRELIGRLLGPEGPEVDLRDVCLALLDEYVELEVAGADPAARLPGMRAHLYGCLVWPRGPREPARLRPPDVRTSVAPVAYRACPR